ncbi:MAG: glycosyltransferase [Rhodothalassiaceae bacterium]
MKDKHILYVTHRFPYPPAGGAKVRAYHSIRHLAADNRVIVAAPVRDEEEAEAVSGLMAEGVDVLTGHIGQGRAIFQSLLEVARFRPASMGWFHSPALVRAVRAHIRDRRPDLIVVHCSSVAPSVMDVPVPKALDFVDMDSCKWQDYARMTPLPRAFVYALEGRRMARAERRLARAFDLNIVTTPRERESLHEIAGDDIRSAVIRNGVDLAYFTPADDGGYDPDLICFVGRMDYMPNARAMIDFCRDVLPRLEARRPGLRLAIVGAEPGADVRALAALPNVHVTGTVPDVRDHVRRAALSIAPLSIARGTQNKILESMAMGIPVVASRLAAGGVDAEPGRHLLAADGPEETAAAILSLLEDPDLRARLSRDALAHMRATHGWDRAMTDFSGLLEQMIDQRRRRS